MHKLHTYTYTESICDVMYMWILILEKRPVLLGHGLFQCGGDFLVNEDKSMAFVLADQGYDVWIGNTRAARSFDHISLSHEDSEYWAWGLKELAIYDWPAMIDFIREETGFHKVKSQLNIADMRKENCEM